MKKKTETHDDFQLSKEICRRVLEFSPDPVVIYDMAGCVMYINPAFTRVFGWTSEELTGEKIDFVPEENWSETQTMIDKAIAGENFSGFETRRFTKNGKIIDVSISEAVFTDSRGKPQGGIVNLRDITRKKQLEERILQSHKMEAVGTLAGGIAHDFNNILQAISGYTEILMLDKNTDSGDYNFLKAIEKSTERASELTRQLLIFGRKVESKLRPTELNREVKQVATILKRTIPKMIDIELRLSEPLTKIRADPVRLEQVMMNVSVNAMDAMPNGGKLRFETNNFHLDSERCKSHKLSTPGDYVLLKISDTGTGMEDETIERMFEPFFTTRETGKGTGLGLAMVYSIIQIHGGEISCASSQGHGTTFEFYFPALTPEKIGPPEISDKSSVPRGKEWVLLVDDEETIRNLGRDILERFGYHVVPAESGERALDLYENRDVKPDIVILDLNMPGMGGAKCLELLRERHPGVKVIIASGYTSNGHEEEALEAGAAGFIGKPYKMIDMLKIVREILDR